MLALQSRIDKSWHLGAVLVIAAALRLSVFAFTALPAVLETRPELSTPITSFRSRKSRRRVRVFVLTGYSARRSLHTWQWYKPILRRGIPSCISASISRFNGELLITQSPLYLAWFSYIVPASSYPLTGLLWTLVDLLAAWALAKLWTARSSRLDRTALVALL